MTKPIRKSYGADRPLTTIVALDAAYSGMTGLAVGRLDEPSSHVRWWSGLALGTEMSEWLGPVVAELTPPGSRAVLVAEADAFGPSVARKLGITIGAVEGLLLDLNAVVQGTRLDVQSRTWRSGTWGAAEVKRVAGLGKAKARKEWKAKAVARALELLAPFRPDPSGNWTHDAAEALVILDWAKQKVFTFGETLCPE